MGEYRLADPEYALKTELHYQRLVAVDPALGMQGTGQRDVELIYTLHELQGTPPDWEAVGKGDLGFTVGLLKSLVEQVKDTVEGAAVLVHGALVKLPAELVLGIATLVKDPGGTVENVGEHVGDIIAKIKALPEYIEHAPAEVKAYLDNINALEDPFEQGEALGKLMCNVLPTAVLAGGTLGRTLKGVKKAAKGFNKVQRGVKGGKWNNVPVVKEKVWSNTIQQTFQDVGSLKGVGKVEADRILKLNGFVFKGRTPGGYYKYYHPNGAKIQVRPNGQVYRYGGGKGRKYHADGSDGASHGQEKIFD